MFYIGRRDTAVIALALSSCFSLAHAADSGFAGEWGYRDTCKFSHSASVSLTSAADGFTGTWSDGTNVDGDSGLVKGVERDGKLYVRFCSEQGEQGGLKNAPRTRMRTMPTSYLRVTTCPGTIVRGRSPKTHSTSTSFSTGK